MSRNLDPMVAAWERHKQTDGHAAAIGGGSKSGALWSAFLAGWDARHDYVTGSPEMLTALRAVRTHCREKLKITTREFAAIAGVSATKLCEWTMDEITTAPDLAD